MKKREWKISKGASARDAKLKKRTEDAKAFVKGLLEQVRADHLEAADGLKLLLSQIDQASPYLLGKFVAAADRDQDYDVGEHIFSIRIFWEGSLDQFLSLQSEAAERHRERDRALESRRRGRDEAEAA